MRQKITFISDTHGRHRKLDLPGGDILVFGGDMEASSTQRAHEFLVWLSEQDYNHKIVIAGNHDSIFEYSDVLWEEYVGMFGAVYLQDSGCEVEGIKFWGTPWSLPFYDWSFMAPEESLQKKYELIPEDTDILISHGPPKSILDREQGGENCGSKALKAALSRVDPKVCVFGHIHEQGGTLEMFNDTLCLNSSVVSRKLDITNNGIQLHYG